MATNNPTSSNNGNGKPGAPSDPGETLRDTAADAGRDARNDVAHSARAAAASFEKEHERRAVRENRERLAYDFREMVSSAEALLRSTAKYTGAEIDEARARLQEQLDMARERSGDMRETVRDTGQRLAAQADECVRSHPWQSVGAAFVAGMVFAHCTRSRH